MLEDVERQIITLNMQLDETPLSVELLIRLRSLEEAHHSFLDREEHTWHLKSRALWINNHKENNSKFFHYFANYHRNVNTIWEIERPDGTLACCLKEKVEEGINHFSYFVQRASGLPDPGGHFEISLSFY
jgi:hypothetical protein